MSGHLRMTTYVLVVIVLAAAATLAADSGSGTSVVAPDGVMCLTPVMETSYIAVRFDLSPSQALAGVRWYNNDAGVLYPRVLVANGGDQGAPSLNQAQSVSQDVRGESSAWSSKTFEESLVTDSGALYVIFQLPAGCEYVARGSGGGPGIGYQQQDQISWVYLSPDGQEWSRMSSSYRLLVEPVLAERGPGMTCLRAPAQTSAPIPIATAGPRLTSVYPNPSNPETRVTFTTDRQSPISLSIYDIRGRLVRTLLRSEVGAGTYMVEWKGDDDRGRRAASGTYFVQLRGNGEPSNEQLVVVR